MPIEVIQRKSGKRYRAHLMRNGKRISKVFPRKRDAELYLAQILANDDLSNLLTNNATAKMTLSEACREYLSQHTGRDTSIGQRLRWWCEMYGDKPTGKVTKANVRDALRELKGEGKAPATLNRYKAALSALYAFLGDEFDCTHNPAREVKQFKEDNGRTRFLGDEELDRLLAATRNSSWDRLYLLVLLAVTTGARRSELLGLTWDCIDFRSRTARLERTKNSEPRVLPLTPAGIEELSRFREVGKAYVFPHPNHQQNYFRNFDKHWQTALKTAAVLDFRFHDLRHTAASILAKSGASLLEISEVLGHKSIQMTQRYAHLCTKHKSKLIDNVMGNISYERSGSTGQHRGYGY